MCQLKNDRPMEPQSDEYFSQQQFILLQIDHEARKKL